MKTSKRDSRLRKVFGSVVVAIVALGASTLLAQSAAARQETERVRAALEALPNYGVFDFLAFERDEGSVTLIGTRMPAR